MPSIALTPSSTSTAVAGAALEVAAGAVVDTGVGGALVAGALPAAIKTSSAVTRLKFPVPLTFVTSNPFQMLIF